MIAFLWERIYSAIKSIARERALAEHNSSN